MDQLPVFVYGTLRPGLGNYRWLLAGQTVHEQPATLPDAVMHEGPGFPYVVDGDGVVRGDLVEVRADVYVEVLASLDSLEGYSPSRRANHYDRVVRTVDTSAGPRQTWVYLAAATPDGPVVASGDWLDRDHRADRVA